MSRLRREMRRLRTARRAVDDLHDGQRRFVYARDPSAPSLLATFVCLISARRFGKTEGFLRYAGSYCQRHPRSRICVLYAFRADGKDVAWPLIEDLDEKYGWECHYNQNDLTATFPNGSRIKIYGIDHRFRGQRNDLVLVDEAQEFTDTLQLQKAMRKLVPGLAERQGRVFLIGTPGEIQSGLFWEIVSKETDPETGLLLHPEWALVEGSPFENPYTRDFLERQLAAYKRANPKIEDEPWIQREYFGRWVVDTRHNVITLDPALNYLTEWKRQRGDSYVISVDMGDDCAAFTVGCYNTTAYPWLVILRSKQVRGGLVSEHAEMLKGLLKLYPDAVVVFDPGGVSKTIKRELEQVHGIGIVHAEKENRIGQVELLRTDVSLGLVKVYNEEDPEHPEAHPVAEQWRQLTWKTNRRTGEREEGYPRDLHDTVLYMRRFVAKHLFEPAADAPPEYGTREWWQLEEARIDREMRLEAQQLAEARGNRWH